MSIISAFRIWARNLRFDNLCGNVTQKVRANLCKDLKELFKDPRNYNAPGVTVERLLQQKADDFCLKGQRRPVNVTTLCRVVDAAYFSKNLIDKPILEKLGYETDEGDGKRIYEMLGHTIMPEHYKGELHSREKPFFWCTPWEDMTSLVSDVTGLASAADTVRDRLGLNSFGEGVYLLCIYIPSTKLHDKICVAPTAFDGGCNEVYSSCAATDGFGRTLDLAHYNDGVRELVVEKIPLDQDFIVQPIGRTNYTPTKSDFLRLYRRCRQRYCQQKRTRRGP